MPPPAAAPTPTATIPHVAIAPAIINLPIMDTPPSNNDNAGGATFKCC